MNKKYQRNRIDLPIGVKIIAYLILFLSGPFLIKMMMDTLAVDGIFSKDFLSALILFIILPLSSILILAKKKLGYDILSFIFITLFFAFIVSAITNKIKPKPISILISTIPFLIGIYLLLKRKAIINVIKKNKEIAKPTLPIDYRILARIIGYSTIYYSETFLIFFLSVIVYDHGKNIAIKDIINIIVNFCFFILSIFMIMGKKLANYFLASLYIILSAFILSYKIIFKEWLFFKSADIALSIISLFFAAYLIFRKASLDSIRMNLRDSRI